jgi:hypothetical protein
MMSRGEEEAVQALRAALEKARTDLRRYRENDLTAPYPALILEGLERAVGEALTAWEESRQTRAPDPCSFAEVFRREASDEGRGGALRFAGSSPQEAVGTARAGESSSPQEAVGTARAGEKRPTAREATVPLLFSRPKTYVVEDPARRQKITITVEDLCAS